ncbi:hypothetical protein HDV57DRAFT_488504 [Trichoderma longibrachiatum]|uniref:CFEM domain-containing protein n=1 Tax=Trichoderma longibrachiatum ATCC 18648 TaxID=983965 RepID=A0A2T4BWR1_TRILO|nr:hypothetical protein M440DRAFT_346097 [Trichoderma longibrachiatum ATCC 18648]
MHSTLVFLLGLAILGSASPLAGVAPSNSTSSRLNNVVTINVANKTLAAATNSTMNLPAAAAPLEDPPANPPSINDLPPCCVPCVTEGIQKETQCALEDVACICENKTKIGKAAKDCVVEACGLNTAIKLVGPAVKKLCDMDDDDMEAWAED